MVLPSQSIAGRDSKGVITTETATSVTPDSPEITSDFMPVGYASVSSLQEVDSSCAFGCHARRWSLSACR